MSGRKNEIRKKNELYVKGPNLQFGIGVALLIKSQKQYN